MSAHKKHKEHLDKAKAIKAGDACLRDQFAMAALPTLCHVTVDHEGACADIATRAYMVADAMLIAREPPVEEAAPPA